MEGNILNLDLAKLATSKLFLEDHLLVIAHLAVDVAGAAGTAIFFHTGSLHAGTVRQTTRHRHSIHLYYGHAPLPPLSDRLTAVPKRLSNSADPEIRRLFSKKNEITQLFEKNFS